MGFAPTWLREVSPLLHKTTLTTGGFRRETIENVSDGLRRGLNHPRVGHGLGPSMGWVGLGRVSFFGGLGWVGGDLTA